MTLLHAGILISDMKRSAAFYEGLLGWRRDPRPEMGFDGAWYKIGDSQLHLMEAEEPGDIPRSQDSRKPGRDGHFAVRVPDFDRVMAECESRKIEVHRGEMFGKRRAFLRDPDGNMVELWES